MILSYRYKYIFIKTKKTAGTTVEMNLAPSCGPEDVITELGSNEEMLRGNGEPLCRNFATPEIVERVRQILASGGKGHKMDDLPKRRDRNLFWGHMRAADIRARLPKNVWKSSFKFTIERHPYEKAVSMAYFTHRRQSLVSFENHLDETVKRGSYAGFPFYAGRWGMVAVDEIIRTESLHEDLKRIGAKLGFPVPDKLISAKTRSRADRRPAREILSEKQRGIVYRLCKKEFKLLGYEP